MDIQLYFNKHKRKHNKMKNTYFFMMAMFLSFSAYSQITIGLSGQEPSCPGFTNGTITADINGGMQPYTIEWNTGADGIQLTGGAGTYSITVTDADGATASESFTLNDPTAINPVVDFSNSVCDDPSSLEVTTSGGVAPLSYVWDNGETTAAVTGLAAGVHCVTVTDANGCMEVGCQTVSDPFSITLHVFNVTCFNGCDASIEAVVSGGVAPYSFLWSNGATTQVNPDLPFGTYSVTVTDGNGCVEIATTTVLQGNIVNLSVTSTNPTCDVGDNGSATAEASGGSPPYTYDWSNGQSGQTITGLTPGTYTVTATDSQGCLSEESVTLDNEGFDIDVSASFVCGSASGSATVTPNGGTPPYTYQWSDGQTTATATDLPPNNTYNVTVTDATSCIAVGSVLVSGTDDVNVSVSSTNPSCNGDVNGSASATASGGTAPYSYLWSTGQDTPDISNIGAGTYSVTVSDTNGCGGTASITITEPEELTASVEVTNAICAAPNSGSATAVVSGGTAPYSYAWNTNETTATITGLGSGGYMVFITDANGCTTSAMGNVIATADLEINISSTDVSCNGEADGSAMVIVTSGTGSHAYAWSNGAMEASISGLTAGTYSVTVSDETGCSGTASVTISEPSALSVNLSSTNADCGGGANATATAVASGGTAPYTYLWSNGSTEATIENLTVGTYSVSVTDANGCTTSSSINVSEAGDVSISVTSQDVSCNGASDGMLAATVSGGTPPYMYNWSNGASTATLDGVGPGTYSVTITDSQSCSASSSGSVSEPSAIALDVSSMDVGCNASSDSGSASVTASGGTSPYGYAWSNGATSASISNLDAGDYSVTVTDANACTETANVTISTSDLSVVIDGTNLECEGDNNGTAIAQVSGGTPPFAYVWSNGQSSQSIENLAAGTYAITVSDSQGCIAIGNIVLTSASQVNLSISTSDISCPGANDGSATVTPSGGTPPYSYSWSNGSNSPSISNLAAGSYGVTITDANGCTATGNASIIEASTLQVSLSTSGALCGDEGSISANASGGTPPYSYSWSNGASGSSISNLGSGTYSATVTDSNGCTATASATLIDADVPTCSISITQEISSAGASDGAATVSGSGGQAPYSYAWSNGTTGSEATGLGSGTYTVTITDANACQSTCQIDLEDPSTIKVGDFAWNDVNRNGIQDPGEEGLADVIVRLEGMDVDGNSILIGTTTDADGYYLFENLNPGTYKLTFKGPDGFEYTHINQGENDDTDSDVDPETKMTDFFTLDIGDCILNMDAGFYEICVNIVDPGEIAGDQLLCVPNEDAAPIVNVREPSGGQGDLEIIWMQASLLVPFSNSAWTIIAGANGLSYDPGLISETTYFARCVRRSGCSEYEESNIIKIEVGPFAIAAINAPDEACVNENIAFSAAPSGAGATYHWDFGPGATPSTSNERFTSASWSTTGHKEISLTVERLGCSMTRSHNIWIREVPSVCNGDWLVMQVNVINAQDVNIEWQVAADADIYEFEVQRSIDGQHFTSIEEAEMSIQTRAGMNYYHCLDPQPRLGQSFYRLHYTSINSTMGYSNEEMIFIAWDEVIYTYPNPVEDQVTLELPLIVEQDAAVDVLDAYGRRLFSTMWQSGQKQITLDFGDYATGIYYVKINRLGEEPGVIRMIKR